MYSLLGHHIYCLKKFLYFNFAEKVGEVMAPSSYVSTYQGDFGGRSRTLAGKASRPGPSLISRQGGGGGMGYSKPQSVSSSPMGQPHSSQGYNKFSPAEWSNSNTYHYNRYWRLDGCRQNELKNDISSADQSRHQSERIRGEALRLIADRDRRTVSSQRLVDQQLADRLRNTTSWRSELSAELDRNKNETNLLFKTRFGSYVSRIVYIFYLLDLS